MSPTLGVGGDDFQKKKKKKKRKGWRPRINYWVRPEHSACILVYTAEQPFQTVGLTRHRVLLGPPGARPQRFGILNLSKNLRRNRLIREGSCLPCPTGKVPGEVGRGGREGLH